MTTVERQATSGLALAVTLLVLPASVDASPRLVPAMAPRTSTSASPDRALPTAVSYQVPRGSASGGDRGVIDASPRATIAKGDELEGPSVKVTRLAAMRAVDQGAALRPLYKRIAESVAQRGLRVTQLVLAGEDLVDSASDDLVLEVYVQGLANDEARLDLWEALSAEVERTVSSPLLLERLALVVHGTVA